MFTRHRFLGSLTKKVDVFVDAVGLDAGEDELLNKFFPTIIDNAFCSTNLQSLLLGRLEVLYKSRQHIWHDNVCL
jgi:hypothetical protein